MPGVYLSHLSCLPDCFYGSTKYFCRLHPWWSQACDFPCWLGSLCCFEYLIVSLTCFLSSVTPPDCLMISHLRFGFLIFIIFQYLWEFKPSLLHIFLSSGVNLHKKYALRDGYLEVIEKFHLLIFFVSLWKGCMSFSPTFSYLLYTFWIRSMYFQVSYLPPIGLVDFPLICSLLPRHHLGRRILSEVYILCWVV